MSSSEGTGAFAPILARFIRERRKENRLTQDDLASLAGVGRRFVSEVERGKPSLRLEKVECLLRVFGKGLGIVAARSPERGDG